MPEPYGDPAVDALIPHLREYFVANFLDGSEDGHIMTPGSVLADSVAEMFAVWIVDKGRAQERARKEWA